jgi:hypothetical protein
VVAEQLKLQIETGVTIVANSEDAGSIETDKRPAGSSDPTLAGPRARGRLSILCRRSVPILLAIGLFVVIVEGVRARKARSDVQRMVTERGGSYSIDAAGDPHFELPQGRFSHADLRQIHRTFPTAEMSLRTR